MTEVVLILGLISLYYAALGYRYMALQRLSEPIFIVNVLYLANFPLRTICLLLIPDLLESAPALEVDLDILGSALLYGFACVVTFNATYQYFMRNTQTIRQAPGIDGPPLTPLSPIIFYTYLLLGVIYLYYSLTATGNKTLIVLEDASGVPRGVRVLNFTMDFITISSFLMYLAIKRRTYFGIFAIFFTSIAYNAFSSTAKYPMVVYTVVLLIALQKVGYRVKLWHVCTVLCGFVIPYVLYSGVIRTEGALLLPDVPFSERLSWVASHVEQLSVYELFQKYFLLRVTDRQVYLETLMLYMQRFPASMSVDAFDRWGGLATGLDVMKAVLHIGNQSGENIHVWFGNKYWYGLEWPAYEVVIPFGRITDSFIMLSYLGCLLFVVYGYVFAWLYRAFYLSNTVLAVTLYLLIYYYYIFVDDHIFFNMHTIAYLSIFVCLTQWLYSAVWRGLGYTPICAKPGVFAAVRQVGVK